MSSPFEDVEESPFEDVSAKPVRAKRDLTFRSPVSGVVGAASRPEDIPGFIGNVVNAMTGVKPVINNPVRFAASGLPGVNMVEGVNLLTDAAQIGLDLAGAATGSEMPQLPRMFPTEQAIYPEPKSAEGQLLGTALELTLPFAGGKVMKSRVSPRFQTAEEISSEIDNLERAGVTNVRYLNNKEKAAVSAVETATKSTLSELDGALKNSATQFENQARETVLQTRGKAISWIKDKYQYFNPKLQSALDVPKADADNLISVVRAKNPYVTEADISYLTRLQKQLATTPGKTIPATKLLAEFTPGTVKAGPYTTVDHIKGVAKDVLLDYLVQAGDTNLAASRAEYSQFAKFRNAIFNIIQPYAKAGEYDTKKAVRLLKDAASGKLGPDGQAFLQAYTEIDSNLAGLVQDFATQMKALAQAKSQAALRGSQESQRIRQTLGRKKFEVMEKAEDKINRLTQEMQTASTSEGRARANHELKKWLGRLGFGLAASYALGRGVGSAVSRTPLPPLDE